MDKNKSANILKAFGNPSIKISNTNLVFARQSQEDVNNIEKMSDDELVQHWKSLNWINNIYGQVSLNDLQRIALLELEIDNRPNINTNELKDWITKSEDEFNNNEFDNEYNTL